MYMSHINVNLFKCRPLMQNVKQIFFNNCTKIHQLLEHNIKHSKTVFNSLKPATSYSIDYTN